MSAHPLEILGQLGQALGKMGIGDLGKTKFGHAALVTLRPGVLPPP
jgi:hypothetical protein